MEVSAAARLRLPQLAKYEVLEEIGHGGMATVYRARDRRLEREVAVKVIHPHLRDSKEVVSRFSTEAQAVAKLRHPNIVEVFDVSEAGEDELYLVAELLRGTTLRKLLQEHKAMPPEVAAGFALELLAALAHAHAAGVVHRDIKPENVLCEHRPSVVVKLTDFGIAKLLDAQGVTSTGQVLGSPAHMAPEQIEGGEVDVRADVFGLGVFLYECMVGHLPFEGSNPAQVLRRVLDGLYPEAQAERPAIGARWSGILDHALARAPSDRYASATAMRDAILAELHRLGIEEPRREIEAWLDDAEAYEKTAAATLIARLCDLAGDAKKQGNVLLAAADYNRALAQAPDDPRLLRIVASLNRAQSRARFMRRAGAGLAVLVAVGAIAVGVQRLVHRLTGHDTRPIQVDAINEGPLPAAVSTRVVPVLSVSASALETPSGRPSPPVIPRIVERSVQLDLQPSMGVTVTIDGSEKRPVASGDTLRLDSRQHSLSFSCPVCNTVRRDLPAGERDEPLSIRIPIKPASLVILGAPDDHYQLVEHPEVSVRVGSNGVPLSSSFERITVKQIETNASVSVRLEAGKSVDANF